MKRIRVLVVEDSRFFQELLVSGINHDPQLEVCAVASDPYEARDAIVKFKPDVMTLDVELPRMSGIEFLKKLMPQYPVRTIVVSAVNESVFEALDAGAVDFVNKPIGGSSPEVIFKFISEELCGKIKVAAVANFGQFKPTRVQNPGRNPVVEANRDNPMNFTDKIVAIGASTGGTEAIFDVVKSFRKDIPGVVIVQHMPPVFTGMYAERLNRQCNVMVREAHDKDVVTKGTVLIANGAEHMRLVKVGNEYRVECQPGEKVSGHCPSVDVLFESVAKVAKDKAIGVLLTGMGADGAKGLLAMRKAGAETIGQDAASSVVYGMPKVAYEIGAVKYQLGLSEIAGKVYQLLNKKSM